MIFSFSAKNTKRVTRLKQMLTLVVIIMLDLCVKATGSVLC